MSASSSVRPRQVVIVDRKNVVSDGLLALMEHRAEVEVLAGPSDPDRALTLDVAPDVVVADIDAAADGPGLVRRLQAALPDSPILVLTLVDDPGVVRAALAAGAAGYVLKSAETAEFLDALATVARGERYLQPSLGVAVAREHGAEAHDADALLSRSETHVLRLLVHGFTNNEIATARGVSLRTIETQRANILRRLGLRTRADLVAYAREHGIVESGG
jgi:two-component system, NarL family, response regulator NreC